MERIDIAKLRQAYLSGKNIALLGAGHFGYAYFRILDILEIPIRYAADSNSEKLNRKIWGGVECVPYSALSGRDDIVSLITVAKVSKESVKEEAQKNRLINVVDSQLILIDLIRNYRQEYLQVLACMPFEGAETILDDMHEPNTAHFGEKTLVNRKIAEGEKVAVYTGVFGKYDKLRYPKYLNEKIDFFYISDDDIDLGEIKYQKIKNCIPKNLRSSILKNRYVKMNPYAFLQDYRYVIYVDGNINVVGDVTSLICECRSGINLFAHPVRDCIYQEAVACINCGKATYTQIGSQISKYVYDDMPSSFGLAAMGFIIFDLQNENCRRIMEAWWEEFQKYPFRDQLSFPYVLWKCGMTFSDIGILGQNLQECSMLQTYKHIK